MPSAHAKEIFLDALAQFGADRAAILAKTCAADPSLRAEVEELLRVHDAAGQFLNAPPGSGRTRGIVGGIANPSVSIIDLPTSEKLGTVIGRYKLLQQIGEGGFGVVYMAEQEQPVRRKVALKIIKLGMDTRQVIARFEAERQALALMEHPNIAKVLDAGVTENGRPYFVMELVKGIPITQFCDREEFSLSDRLKLFLDVCSAVQHAHTKGIIHRDIKPSNILVTLHDARPVPKVIDFGIAKATEQKLTERTMFTDYGQFIGTPAYMSPEQAELSGLDMDTRSDIYSLGVLLYELLTGSLPFDPQRLLSAGQAGMARIIKEEEPHRPSTRLRTLGSGLNDTPAGSSPSAVTQPVVPARPGGVDRPRTASLLAIARLRHTDPTSLVKALRGDLDWIVMKCLEKDRTRRYESAGSLARDVARFLVGETVSAAPPSRSYRASKFLRRHRAFVTTMAMVGAALVLGLASTTAGFLQARQQRNAAQTAYAGEQEQRRIAVTERDRARDYSEELRHELYASKIEKIQRILATDGLEPVKPLLAECDQELRGWEWERLSFLADRSEATIQASDAPIGRLEYSADGSVFASADDKGVTRVWDTATLNRLAEFQEPQTSGTLALSCDGTLFATYHAPDIQVRNTRSGELLRTIPSPHGGPHDADFDQPGSRLAVVYWDGVTRVVSVATGELLMEASNGGHGGQIIAFSKDGTRLLVGYGGMEVSVASALDGGEFWRKRGAAFLLRNAAFSPDEKYVASVGYDSRLWLRYADTGELVYTVSTGKGTSAALDFHPDGDVIAVGGIDGLISLFRTTTGEKLYSLHGHESAIGSIAFDSTGRYLISGARDGTIKRWHLGCGGPQVIVRHIHVISQLQFSADDSNLWASGGSSRDLQAIRVAELDRAPVDCPMVGMRRFAISSDGERIALSGYMDDGVYYVLLTDKDFRVLQQWRQPEPIFASLGFSPDRRHLATGVLSGPMRVYDTATGAVLWEYGDRNDDVLIQNPVLFSRDGQFIINGSREGTIRVFAAASGELLREFPVAEHQAGSIVLSSAGDRLYVRNGNNIEVWDWVTAEHQGTMTRNAGPVTALAMLPDDSRLVSGGADGTVRLWDVEAGRQVMLVGRHDNQITDIAVSHDGATIATGGEDNALRIWETRFPSSEGLNARYDVARQSWVGYRDSE